MALAVKMILLVENDGPNIHLSGLSLSWGLMVDMPLQLLLKCDLRSKMHSLRPPSESVSFQPASINSTGASSSMLRDEEMISRHFPFWDRVLRGKSTLRDSLGGNQNFVINSPLAFWVHHNHQSRRRHPTSFEPFFFAFPGRWTTTCIFPLRPTTTPPTATTPPIATTTVTTRASIIIQEIYAKALQPKKTEDTGGQQDIFAFRRVMWKSFN
jgi:hypothetical protein